MSSKHLYPMGKGDPLCPLGFHPQVRWPTRCKRCFRDYKEHGGKRKEQESFRKDDITASSPALSSFGTPTNRRSWSSSTTLDDDKEKEIITSVTFKNPSSWTSTPDLANLDDDSHASIPTVSLTLPFRRKVTPIDTGQPKETPKPKTTSSSSVLNQSDSLSSRARKYAANRESTPDTPPRRSQVKDVKPTWDSGDEHDVQFSIKLKPKTSYRDEYTRPRSDSLEVEDDAVSMAGTDTTESTTLVDYNEYNLKNQLDNMRQELEATKTKCERLEKEKSNILLRRLTAMDTKGNSSEVLKLQQKVNELQSQLDDHKDEKKSLNLKVKELEEDLDNRPAPQATQKMVDELKSKLLAAETLCEELMDENEDMKKELRDMEEEMEEMQDHFREDQADEYSSLKKELEQATKNCRILSFKLRKTERKTEQLEQEKGEFEKKVKELSINGGDQQLDRLKQLEKDLAKEKETSSSLQKKLDDANVKLSKATEIKLPSTLPKKKAPMLGTLGKSASSEMKVSRESLTRGGSQDDPVQLLRDLQDSLEREADLREQLKFAEEEAETSRRKASRIEEDNEGLVLQLKKMATTPRTRPMTRKSSLTKDDKDEDPSVLKLQLELNEQETAVLRKKIEELESDNERHKKKAKELQDKINSKVPERKFTSKFERDNEKNEKVSLLEKEMNDIRTKLIEKERDCERLEAEIKLTKKIGRDSSKTRSSENLEQSVDLKRQLQVIEQEASVFRKKAQDLETENEKLQKDIKRMELLRTTKTQDKSFDTYVDKIAKLEVELETSNKKIKDMESSQNSTKKSTGDADLAKKVTQVERERDKLIKLLDKVKENTSEAFKNRKPKAPTELSTKLALRTMINDLENEVQSILGALGTKESEFAKLEEELSKSKTSKGSKDSTNKELEELTKKHDSLQKESQKDKTRLEELNQQLATDEVEKDEFKLKISKLKAELEMLTHDNKRLDEDVTKLKGDSFSLRESKREVLDLKNRCDLHLREIEKKDAELIKLKEELDEKSKVSKELTLKTKRVAELQKKLKEAEDEIGSLDRETQEKIKKLEATVQEEKKKTKEESQSKDKLTAEKDKLNDKIYELEKTIANKNSSIEQLEKSLQKERTASSVVLKSSSDAKELKSLKDEIQKLKNNLEESESKYKATDKKAQIAEEKLKKQDNELKTERSGLEKKVSELEIDLQNERKKLQIQKSNAEKEQKNRELELTALKNKIKSLELNGGGSQKISEVRQEYQDKIDKMEKEINKSKKEYDNLTAKYEVLEEEHVVTKAKLVSEMESLTTQLFTTRKELERLEENYEGEKDELHSQYKILKKEYDDLSKKMANNEADNPRYKVLFEKKQEEIDQAKRENEMVHDQIEFMRKENDELRKKLDDFDKVSKIQRNISADSSAMDKEIRELKSKLTAAEKSKKSDLSECKMRYDGQITILNDELHSLHAQVTRFKREKDTYKHMLEGAQKTIGDLKSNPGKENRNSIASIDDMEEYKSKIANLEQQISCMEDELSESRLEASKLKTELISERSISEVRLSELNSRVNELEEEKILSSGRTKIVGLRTRMELSWQKEREDQQRLLQETATLARDLRQTLFEQERERDKEVLESKRKLDQLKKTLEEDQAESKKKLNELQCDFMELRDAHAKLRTTNEKLRREKDRHEKEREELKAIISERKRSEQDDLRRIQILVQQVENLLHVAPELFSTGRGERAGSEAPYTPTPPKRNKSKSREGSPSLERRDFSRESSIAREEKRSQVQNTLQRLVDATEELRKVQERDRIKRMNMRRATSTENDQLSNGSSSTRKLTRNDSNLHRKSLSLEHTASMQDRSIWKGVGDDDSMSSLQSLETGSDMDFRYHRDASLDSRLSSGSTQSEISGEKKKKKSLMGKLKKLTKSRSIDDSDDSHFSPTKPLSSSRAPSQGSDIMEDPKGSKKDLKERITGMFKRSGSQSRSNSVERQIAKPDTSSTQRPLMHNTNGSSTATPNSSMDRLTKPKKNIKL